MDFFASHTLSGLASESILKGSKDDAELNIFHAAPHCLDCFVRHFPANRSLPGHKALQISSSLFLCLCHRIPLLQRPTLDGNSINCAPIVVMAYEGFQHNQNPYGQQDNTNPNMPENHASYYEPPYPYQPVSDQLHMPQPRAAPNTAAPQAYYPEPPREQNAWPPPPPPQSGRIDEAVTSAVGNSAHSSHVSPDLVAQITANVIQQLGAAGLNSPAQQTPQPPRSQWASPQPYPNHSASHTPIGTRSTPEPSTTYQPPPHPAGEYAGHPKFAGTPHAHARSTPTPPHDERRGSASSQFSEKSQRTDPRPNPPMRTDTFPTTLEKIWGGFFAEGKPTARLGQFLRGIAMHLVG